MNPSRAVIPQVNSGGRFCQGGTVIGHDQMPFCHCPTWANGLTICPFMAGGSGGTG